MEKRSLCPRREFEAYNDTILEEEQELFLSEFNQEL